MKVKNILIEDLINYKKISLFIGTPTCNGKCWREKGLPSDTCQNFTLCNQQDVELSNQELINMFDKNILQEAVVFGGLEPFEIFADILEFIHDFRKDHDNDIVIYTGFEENEINGYIKILSLYKNIIIKFGRFIPNDKPIFDNLLGVNLASSNQYSKKVGI